LESPCLEAPTIAIRGEYKRDRNRGQQDNDQTLSHSVVVIWIQPSGCLDPVRFNGRENDKHRNQPSGTGFDEEPVAHLSLPPLREPASMRPMLRRSLGVTLIGWC
jgi:hypothetical protein